MKVNITEEIRQEILDALNRDTAKEYFEKLRDTEKNPTRGQVYAYRSWEQSTEDRADMFEVRALPWGSQIKDGVMKEFVAALTAADIDEIIVTRSVNRAHGKCPRLGSRGRVSGGCRNCYPRSTARSIRPPRGQRAGIQILRKERRQ